MTNIDRSLPSQSQSPFTPRIRRARFFCGKQATSTTDPHAVCMECSPNAASEPTETQQARPRSTSAGPILTITSRHREVRESGRTRPIPRGQPSTSDTGTQGAGFRAKLLPHGTSQLRFGCRRRSWPCRAVGITTRKPTAACSTRND